MASVVHFIKAGGFVMYPLLLISLVAVVIIVERFLAFSQFGNLAQGLLPEVLKQCSASKYDQALALCEGRKGPVAHCMSVVLRHRHQPSREIERLVEETGQDYFIRMERLLPVLDTTTTISPLLGLLGTIVGMIGTFNAISAQQSRGNSDAVLAGVGEALYATASGILIAVICFMAYNYFTSRLRTITAETEQAATKLMNALTEIHHRERAGQNHYEAGAQSEIEEKERRGVQEKARA
jgi:biopolymer transport protein ExbB